MMIFRKLFFPLLVLAVIPGLAAAESEISSTKSRNGFITHNICAGNNCATPARNALIARRLGDRFHTDNTTVATRHLNNTDHYIYYEQRDHGQLHVRYNIIILKPGSKFAGRIAS